MAQIEQRGNGRRCEVFHVRQGNNINRKLQNSIRIMEERKSDFKENTEEN